MFNVTGGELAIILVIALVVLGPEKLPDVIRKAGRLYGELRQMANGFQAELRDAFEEPTRELRETAELARKSVTGALDDVRSTVTDTFRDPPDGQRAEPLQPSSNDASDRPGEPEEAVSADPDPTVSAEPEHTVSAEPDPTASAEPEHAVSAEPVPAFDVGPSGFEAPADVASPMVVIADVDAEAAAASLPPPARPGAASLPPPVEPIAFPPPFAPPTPPVGVERRRFDPPSPASNGDHH